MVGQMADSALFLKTKCQTMWLVCRLQTI